MCSFFWSSLHVLYAVAAETNKMQGLFSPPGCFVFVMVSFVFRGRYIFIFIPSPSFLQLQQLLSGNLTVLNPYFDAIIVTLYAGE